MPDASAEGRPDDSAVLGLTYQSLMARYSSNFATEWQILGLGLTAQGFIVAASSAVENRVFTASSLAVVILLVGAVTVISSLRAGMYSRIDRIMLDEYERSFLVGDLERYRLLHSAPYGLREASAPEQVPLSRRRLERALMQRIVKPYGPMRWWIVLEIAISVSGASIPLLGIFGL